LDDFSSRFSRAYFSRAYYNQRGPFLECWIDSDAASPRQTPPPIRPLPEQVHRRTGRIHFCAGRAEHPRPLEPSSLLLKSPPRRSTGVRSRPAAHSCRRPCWTEDENEDAAGAFARRLGTCRWAPLAHRRCLGRLRACSSPRCYCRGVRERARTAAAAPSAAVGASVASRCCKPWEGSLPMA